MVGLNFTKKWFTFFSCEFLNVLKIVALFNSISGKLTQTFMEISYDNLHTYKYGWIAILSGAVLGGINFDQQKTPKTSTKDWLEKTARDCWTERPWNLLQLTYLNIQPHILKSLDYELEAFHFTAYEKKKIVKKMFKQSI